MVPDDEFCHGGDAVVGQLMLWQSENGDNSGVRTSSETT